MSYAERKITVIFTLADDDFGAGNNQVTVEGLRVEAQIDNSAGVNGSTLYAKIYGMKESDMLKCCTYAQTFQSIKNILVTVLAGDDESGMSQIFQGTINDALIDYNEMPSVPLVVQARCGYIEQLSVVAPNSKPVMDVASTIESLSKSIGFDFSNAGVSVSLSNHYAYGSTIQQIKDIARAAQIGLDISNHSVAIWSSGNPKDETIITISPQLGMIGYPTFAAWGQLINSIFMPDFARGRKCRVTSSIDRACGDFWVQSVTHTITSKMPGGPWMTSVTLTTTQTVGA